MFPSLSWLFSPLGRWAATVGGVLIFILGVYGRGRRDARLSIERKATKDALDRTQAAVRAGDVVDLHAARLRDNDGHRRD
jgi:hypothetical protein